MNELLKEFATQAAQSVQERKSDYFLEKFAELVVEECVTVCEMNPQWDNIQLANLIRIHFGVK
jgi:hypothetical protein